MSYKQTPFGKKPELPDLACAGQGKVRDNYDLSDSSLRFFVATDRISTRDVVHKTFVPSKGIILNLINIFWMTTVLKDFPHHLIAFGEDIYNHLPQQDDYPDDLHLRGIVVKNAEVIPVEFIYRSYLAGSLWGYYKKALKAGSVHESGVYIKEHGIYLPPDLHEMSKFEETVFTPTTKSEEKDMPLLTAEVEAEYPNEVALGLRAYVTAYQYAYERGIAIVDTKIEMGDGMLIDEIFTGDSSRFVYVKDLKTKPVPWADKEIFRIDTDRQWDGGDKVPLHFSDDVVSCGVEAYRRVFQTLTGSTVEQFIDQLPQLAENFRQRRVA